MQAQDRIFMRNRLCPLFLKLQADMLAIEWAWLHNMRLGFTSMIHKVIAELGYITLCEWWNSSTNIFNFPTSEFTITLEDVCVISLFRKILQTP